MINSDFFVPSSCSLRGSSYTLLHVPFLLPAQTLEIAIIKIIVASLQYSKLSWNIKPYLRICSQWVSEWAHSKWVPWGSWQGSRRPSCPPSLPGSPKLAAEAPRWPAARYNVKSRKQERWWWRVDTQPEITVEELQSKIGVQAMFPSCFPAIKIIWIWRKKGGCLNFQPGSWLVGKLSLWLSSWRPPSNPPELHAQPFTFRNKAAAAAAHGIVPITGHYHSNDSCNPKTWTKHWHHMPSVRINNPALTVMHSIFKQSQNSLVLMGKCINFTFISLQSQMRNQSLVKANSEKPFQDGFAQFCHLLHAPLLDM